MPRLTGRLPSSEAVSFIRCTAHCGLICRSLRNCRAHLAKHVFVTVQFSANKCAIELYEKPEKGEKMACLSVLWKSDHLFSSQWIGGDGQFF
jgi:hypothetical protein